MSASYKRKCVSALCDLRGIKIDALSAANIKCSALFTSQLNHNQLLTVLEGLSWQILIKMHLWGLDVKMKCSRFRCAAATPDLLILEGEEGRLKFKGVIPHVTCYVGVFSIAAFYVATCGGITKQTPTNYVNVFSFWRTPPTAEVKLVFQNLFVLDRPNT